ncbi:hypothetical protein PN497_16670 [Sphaerospermopsis kisseleviana CS-549]|uniref:Uncharacterized protein n=1 Tax=Sphaerospermopsis kisseleviana CS-549 TaxID=3021783 RepID=A0ABT4ZU74_9CYAN|nr:hypothetical protein [Sphaerospermopsis kisseleviana]MDB9442982.1 hypothetical protein [Sphaerospermopsis kisseleviana CS-549]BAZ81262.1 hypothetical protein NIES73_25290 [Sphaerospermopsis kisseleviana NIES-73]
MAESTQFNNSQLVRYLSDAEQESLIGGQISSILGKVNLFLQKTDIETEGNSDLTLATGDSTSEKTKYKLSQITLNTSFEFGLPISNRGVNQGNNYLINLLNNIFY